MFIYKHSFIQKPSDRITIENVLSLDEVKNAIKNNSNLSQSVQLTDSLLNNSNLFLPDLHPVYSSDPDASLHDKPVPKQESLKKFFCWLLVVITLVLVVACCVTVLRSIIEKKGFFFFCLCTKEDCYMLYMLFLYDCFFLLFEV
jgi:hypothetical protein